MKSTLSFFRNLSAVCLAMSGFCWSSATMTSAGSPPSLPSSCLIARLNPSRISTPSPAPGPESVDTKPTLILSAAWTEPASISAAARAVRRSGIEFSGGSLKAANCSAGTSRYRSRPSVISGILPPHEARCRSPFRWPRFRHLPCHRPRSGLFLPLPVVRLRSASPRRTQGRRARRQGAGRCRAPHSPSRPRPVRWLGADRHQHRGTNRGRATGHSGDLCTGAQHHHAVAGAGLGRGAGQPRHLRRGQCGRLFRLPRLPP